MAKQKLVEINVFSKLLNLFFTAKSKVFFIWCTVHSSSVVPLNLSWLDKSNLSTTCAKEKITANIHPAVNSTVSNPIRACHKGKSRNTIGNRIMYVRYMILKSMIVPNSLKTSLPCALFRPRLRYSLYFVKSAKNHPKVRNP